MKFTETNTQVLRVQLASMIEQVTNDIYADKIEDVSEVIKQLTTESYKQVIELKRALGDKAFDAKRPHDKVITHIVKNFTKGEERVIPYKLAAMTRRYVTLQMVDTSKIKLRKVAKDTLAGLITAELRADKGRGVTLSEIMSKCTLKSDDIKSGKLTVHHKKGEKIEDVEVDSTPWELAELKLQFIAELCNLDLIDLKLSEHTHMGEVPKVLAKIVDKEMWDKMYQVSQMLDKKTILIEQPVFDELDYVTRSSWFYRSPKPSDAVEEVFSSCLNQIKFQFVDNALDIVEEAYINHLKSDEGKLPENWQQWVPSKVAFFKQQIRASQANGGHYVAWKMDSANRMYTQAEIGHLQTSASLRKLVTVAGIDNQIKYDFRNNVVQMYALLMKAKGLAKYVYLVEEAERKADLRYLIAEEMNTFMIEWATSEVSKSVEGTKSHMTAENNVARLRTNPIFNKDNIKPLFMVWAYNAGKNRVLDGVTIEDKSLFGLSHTTVKVEGLIALTKVVNNEANRDMLWGAFHKTVTTLAPEIVILKRLFKQIIAGNPLTETKWTLPDGTIAQYASAQTLYHTMHFVDSKGKQHQHKHFIKQIVSNAKSTGLLPRVIHSFDAYVARQMLIRAKRLGITIVPNHDSFTFDKKYEEVVLGLANELFLELLEGNYLGTVVAELNTSNKSLKITTQAGETITDELIWTKFGKLTPTDLESAEPLDLED